MKTIEWCVNLCKANAEMMQLGQDNIQRIVKEFPIYRKFTDSLFARKDYDAARYNMALRFVKKYCLKD
jgi:hypothetical protein